MFEKKPEEMTAVIYITDRHAREADAQGVMLWKGGKEVSFAETRDAINKMKRLRVNVPKSQLRRWDSLTNQLRNAFGPDMWEVTA